MINEQNTTATNENAIVQAMRNYSDYNFWANKTLVSWLKTKAPELMHQEVASSFPSIHKTLLHIWQTQQYWYSVISKTASDQVEFTGTTAELFDGFVAHSEQLAVYIREMTAESLVGTTLVQSPWFECNFGNFEYLIHCINHGTYHRGQVITIGRNLGFTDAPMTDYNYFNVFGKQ